MQKVVRGTKIVTGFNSELESLVPVIGYLRVSTWREEKISDEIQMAAITEATARAGRRVVKWVPDLDATGRNFKRKIMEAIGYVETGELEGAREIWVWKFSRFGRSRHGVAINLARIEAVGGELKSATEAVDSGTATGEFTRDMLFAVAAFESNRAGEQWRETHELRRLAGVPAVGGKRFGYKWYPRRVPDGEGGWSLQEERYEVDPPPAEAWTDAYRRYAAGNVGFGTIADSLTESGFTTTRGTRWGSTTVSRAMDTGFAAGLLYVHRSDVHCRDRGKCQRWEAHWTYRPAEHEAIVTGEEWDAYLERRKARKSIPRRSLTPIYPLSGLTRCHYCEGAATIRGGRESRGLAYDCSPRREHRVVHPTVYTRRDQVEAAVFEWLMVIHREMSERTADSVVHEETAVTDDTARTRSRLQAEIGALGAALDRATEGNVMGEIPLDTYRRTRDKLVARRAAKEQALAALPAAVSTHHAGPHDHAEHVETLVREWDVMQVPVKRLMLAALVRRVEIGGPMGPRVVPKWAEADA